MSNETIRFNLHSAEIFNLLAKHELTRAERYPSPVTLLYIKRDHKDEKATLTDYFKRRMAEIINLGVRLSDVPAFYEEDFVILMPSTDAEGGAIAARRLLKSFEELDTFEDFIVAIGITSHPGGTLESLEDVLEQAKSAIKQAGEDGIHFYEK